MGVPLTSSMTKKGRPLAVVPASKTRAMLGWSISASALALGLEAGHDLGGVHARLDDLEGNPALDRLGLLGHPDGSHAAFADQLQQLVRAELSARAFLHRRREGLGPRVEVAGHDWSFHRPLQEVARLEMGFHQLLHLLP